MVRARTQEDDVSNKYSNMWLVEGTSVMFRADLVSLNKQAVKRRCNKKRKITMCLVKISIRFIGIYLANM